jgi:hypothetical protein
MVRAAQEQPHLVPTAQELAADNVATAGFAQAALFETIAVSQLRSGLDAESDAASRLLQRQRLAHAGCEQGL